MPFAALWIGGAGKDPFREGYNIDWSVQLDYGEKIGLGTQKYELVELKEF